MSIKIIPVFLSMALLLASPSQAQDADAVLGHWFTEDNLSIVHLVKEENKYVGRIVWLEEPRYEEGDEDEGKLRFDRENKKKKLRKRPIIGLPFMHGFVYDGKDEKWRGGTIYDPEVGKYYKCEMKILLKEGTDDTYVLGVHGYIGIPTFGRTTSWNRVPKEDLKNYEFPNEDEIGKVDAGKKSRKDE
ncbi:MAG: DUF2147 domain-containing protein [Candidatus Hydrogenedentota bacterium]